MSRTTSVLAAVVCSALPWIASADTTVYFESCQVATPVSSGVTSDTIASQGYLFTYTRDKLFTGGTGHPIGRPVRVPWPAGVEAQAVTTPPPGVTDTKARMTLSRVDGQPFALRAFTARLLANTGGAGAAIEIVPVLNGEDGFADPLYFDATGYYGQNFSYDTTPNPLGSTALLTGFDTYKIGLYVDFAIVALTLDSNAPGLRSCCLAGGACLDATTLDCAVQGGTPLGEGTSCACDPCSTAAGPPPVPDGSSGTTPMEASRLDSAGGSIEVTWDAATCPATSYDLLYGALSGLSGYVLSGAVCGVGTSGSLVWNGVPPGDLYFLMVGIDGSGVESSWGLDGAGQERKGSLASGICGANVKDARRTCP